MQIDDYDDMDLLVPFLRANNDYKQIKKIGKGGFGKVFLVENKKTGELFAKKDIRFKEDDDLATKYFIRELFALYIFRFPGLPFIQFEGFDLPKNIKGKKNAFILTDYVEGGSLGDLIDNKFENCDDIPTAKMIIIYGISFGLMLMHKLNIVHRDLKPENILLNNNKEPIIADFGFARLIKTNEIKSNEIYITRRIGTFAYMAPEIIDDEEEEEEDSTQPDCSMDVYSFGVLILQIISGELTFGKKKQSPFNTKLGYAFTEYIRAGGRFNLPGSDVLPNNLKALIENAWDHNPTNRCTMKEINEKLQSSEFVLPGCKMDKYNEYITRLSNIYHQYEEKNKEKKNEDENTFTEEFNF